MIKILKGKSARVCQGDIYRDIEMVEYAVEKSGTIEISKIIFPAIAVLTQDCDLAQDYKVRWSRSKTRTEDKKLLSALVVPLYNLEHVYHGEQLDSLGIKMSPINRKKTEGRRLKNNETPRYHYLEFPNTVPIVPSVADFKHYFSVNVEYLKRERREKFVCRLAPLFREDLSQRFASFLSRIGLPAGRPS
jgi:hypothetical protein